MTKSHFPLPQDWRDAVLVGRIDMGEGPTPVVVKEGRVFDVSRPRPPCRSCWKTGTACRRAGTWATSMIWA